MLISNIFCTKYKLPLAAIFYILCYYRVSRRTRACKEIKNGNFIIGIECDNSFKQVNRLFAIAKFNITFFCEIIYS